MALFWAVWGVIMLLAAVLVESAGLSGAGSFWMASVGVFGVGVGSIIRAIEARR